MGRLGLLIGFFWLLIGISLRGQDTLVIWSDTLEANWLLRPQSHPMIRADTTGVYLAATFMDTLLTTFDPPTRSKGMYDAVLLKYDALGKIAWRHLIQNTDDLITGHLKRFPSGELILVGYCEDSCQIAGIRSWERGVFALGFSGQGQLQYLTERSLRDHVFPDLDPQHNLYLAQSYIDSIRLDPEHLYVDKSKYRNSLLAVFTAKNQLRWCHLLDTIPDFYRTGGLYAHGVAVDERGRVFVAGYFEDAPFLHKDHLRGFYARDLFLAAYSPQGKHLWTSQLSASPRDFFLYSMYYRYDMGRLIIETRSRERDSGMPDLHHRFSVSPSGADVVQDLFELTPEQQNMPADAVHDLIPLPDGSFYQLDLRSDRRLVISRLHIHFTEKIVSKASGNP
ncbi:MAG: hypothetical protein ACFCUI_06655 [Bernardetiaceae bacterium]